MSKGSEYSGKAWRVAVVSNHTERLTVLSGWLDQPGVSLDSYRVQSVEQCPDLGPGQHDVVVEWLDDSNSLKFEGLRKLARSVNYSAILMSAAYQVLPSEMAMNMPYPSQLVGFNPLGLWVGQRGVSVAQTTLVEPMLREQLSTFLDHVGAPYQWMMETPGMVMPRIYAMLANEAAFALQEGVASVEAIDRAMVLGTNYPMGPLAWADRVGLRTVYGILNHCWQTYREERYRPCLLLHRLMVSQQNFYGLSNDPVTAVPAALNQEPVG